MIGLGACELVISPITYHLSPLTRRKVVVSFMVESGIKFAMNYSKNITMIVLDGYMYDIKYLFDIGIYS